MRSKPGIIKLMISLMVDGIGMLSYLLPGGGEIADAIWAPISAGTILLMYGGIPAAIGLLEELGPGTDIIPTATLSWLYYKFEDEETGLI